MTETEMIARRDALGARYAELARELIEARIELAALGHVLSSPIGGRHFDPGFIGDHNELSLRLSHAAFCPYRSRSISAEINQRVLELAESLRATAA